MTKHLIDLCQDEYKNATGNRFPCSNQIVGCYVLCEKIDSKIKNLLDQKYAKILRKSPDEQLAEFEDEIWRIKRIDPNVRGCRYYKVYIDNRISDEIMEQIIMPCMGMYCKEVNFF